MINTNTYAAKALELARQGCTPIPLTGKKPLVTGWQNLRRVTPEMIADWERGGYFKNLGMVTGSASNNVVVIDFDGLIGYEAFKAHFPELAETLTIATGSGNGAHVYFKVDLLPDSCGVMDIPLDGGELVNIEFKADGKQVVVPPSIHPDTNKPYVKMVDKPIMHLSDVTMIIQWAKALKPQEWQPPTMRNTSTGDLNPALLSAVEGYFRSQPNKQHREWINCSCPNTTAHKHGDKDFSFGYNTEKHFGYCYTCDGGREYLVKDLLPLIGIDAATYGGLFEKREPQQVNYNIVPAVPPTIYLPAPAVPANLIPVVTRSSRLTNYSARIFGAVELNTVPIPFPIQALHGFGGMARVMKPGKLVGIVGISGGGKTSLLESMVDSWLGYHVPSLVWSPEWDGDEFVERAVQRYGGPTVEELYLHEIALYEQKQGIQNGAGVELSKEKEKAALSAVKQLQGWKDEVGYLDMPFLTIGCLQSSIEATLKSLTFQPRVLILDYVQLLLAMEANGDLTMYNLLMRIKAVCKSFNLVGVVATQVTKEGARGQADGKLLDGLAARFVNDDAFNLFVTVNPDRDEQGNFLPAAVLNTTKNSLGQRGKRRVGVQWEKLLFSSFSHPDQTFSEEK